MAQPDYVPVSPSDRVRQTDKLPPARRWFTDRPGEIVGLRPPVGDSFGSPGPDQGYGLVLAKRFADRLVLTDGEHAEDAVAGCLSVALKRASVFGRAPVIYDLELAYSLFGFLSSGAPRDVVEYRRPMFEGAAHRYWDQRGIADVVPESTLRMTPAEVASAVASGGWKALVRTDEGDADE